MSKGNMSKAIARARKIGKIDETQSGAAGWLPNALLHEQPWVRRHAAQYAKATAEAISALKTYSEAQREAGMAGEDGMAGEEVLPEMPEKLRQAFEVGQIFAKSQPVDGEYGPVIEIISGAGYAEFLHNLGEWTKAIKATTGEIKEAARKIPIAIRNRDGYCVYVPRAQLEVLRACVRYGSPVFLTGEPGVGKTELAGILGAEADRVVFHQDMTGLVEVASLEAERVLDQQNGATVTSFIPSPFLRAIMHASEGNRCLLILDELPRVADPQLQNPLLQLLQNRVYHAVTDRRTYCVGDNLSVIATGNIYEGNYSGNNRRGIDDALADRFSFIQLPRVNAEIMNKILAERFSLAEDDRAAIVAVYRSGETDRENGTAIGRVLTPRMAIRLAMLRSISKVSLLELAQIIIPPAHRMNEAGVTAVLAGFEVRG